MKAIIILIFILTINSCGSSSKSEDGMTMESNPLETASDLDDLLGFNAESDDKDETEELDDESDSEVAEVDDVDEEENDEDQEETEVASNSLLASPDSDSMNDLLGVENSQDILDSDNNEVAQADSMDSLDETSEDDLDELSTDQETNVATNSNSEVNEGSITDEILDDDLLSDQNEVATNSDLDNDDEFFESDSEIAALLSDDSSVVNGVNNNGGLPILDLTDENSPKLSENLYYQNGKLMVKQKSDNLALKESDLNDLLGVDKRKEVAPQVAKSDLSLEDQDINDLLGTNDKKEVYKNKIGNNIKSGAIMPDSFKKEDQEALEIQKLLADRDKKRMERRRSRRSSRKPASFNKLVGLKENVKLKEKKYNSKSLFFASRNAVGETLRYLVNRKNIDVNSVSKNDGKTALHYAIENKKFGNIRALLKLGADPTIRDQKGESAKELATRTGIQLPNIRIK